MNVIIETTGFNIGGMEVFFSGFMNYVINQGHEVYFITKDIENDIYHTMVDFSHPNFHLIYRSKKEVVWMSDMEAEHERKKVLEQLGDIDFSDSVAIVGFYIDFQYILNLFQKNPIKMLMIWPHPLNWSNRLFLDFRKYHLTPKRYGRHYHNHRALLRELDEKGGNYYTSYAIKYFNEWFYQLSFKEKKVEGLPIQVNCGESFVYKAKEKIDTLNVLWVGRFDYFKNDAILYIFNNLKKMAEKKNIEICFNIVGKGEKQYEEDIRNRVPELSEKLIKVKYLGVVKPDELTSVFSKNDIGIAMGVTVKQMGYCSLPAIIIDSLSDLYKEDKCCNWVFDIETGDDGDGMYYKLSNHTLDKRRTLADLLEEIIDDPIKLKEYSMKCSMYVKDNYMYERQNSIILQRACDSEFMGTETPRFKHNIIMRCLWKIRKIFLGGNRK